MRLLFTLLIVGATWPVFASQAPIGHWLGSEDDSSALLDASGNGLDGQLINGAGVVFDSQLGDAVLSLDASQQQAVRVPHVSALSPNALSITFWIRPDSIATGTQHIVTKDRSVHPRARAWQFKQRREQLEFLVFRDGSAAPQHAVVKGGRLSVGQWHHVTGTWDGAHLRLFVDGVLVDEQPFAGNLRQNQGNDLWIGRGETSSPYYFDGRLSDIRIYGEGLELAKVQRLADPQTRGMVSHWDLRRVPVPLVVLDDIGADHGNMSTVLSGEYPPEAPSAQRFNGSNDSVRIPNSEALAPRGSFTMTAWVRPDFTSGDGVAVQHIFSKDNYATGHRAWQWRFHWRKPQFIVFDSTGTPVVATADQEVPSGQWAHLAVRYSAVDNDLSLWMDGEHVLLSKDNELVPSLTYADGLPQGALNDAFIGRSENTHPRWFRGAMATVGVYARALDADEIGELAANGPAIGATPIENKLPDFSYAGYRNSEVDLPQLVFKPPTTCGFPKNESKNHGSCSIALGDEDPQYCHVVDVTCYGNNAEAIQSAIDAGIAHRRDPDDFVVIYFPAGIYDISPREKQDEIRVSEGRVVFTGALDSNNQPLATLRAAREVLPVPQGDVGAPFLLSFARTADACHASLIAASYWPDPITGITGRSGKGSHWLSVASANGLAPGDWVTVYKRSECANDEECGDFQSLLPHGTIIPRYEDENGEEDPTKPEWYRGALIAEHHQIDRVSGNQVRLRAPLMIDVLGNQQTGWQLRPYQPLEMVGISNLRIEGGYFPEEIAGGFDHHEEAAGQIRHDDAWSGVCMAGVANSWVNNVSLSHFNRAMRLFASSYTTVAGVAFGSSTVSDPDTVVGHESIRVHNGTGNLVGLEGAPVVETNSFWHGPSVSFGAAGNVFLNYEYGENSSFDAHGTTPYATLLDSVSGGLARSGAGGQRSGGPLHGQPNHLHDFVLWNFIDISDDEWAGAPYTFWAVSGQGKPLTERNLFTSPAVIGFTGSAQTFSATDGLRTRSIGQSVTPQSLFKSQLEARGGQMPYCPGGVPVP